VYFREFKGKLLILGSVKFSCTDWFVFSVVICSLAKEIFSADKLAEEQLLTKNIVKI
jgi:hypothetical protein